MTETEDQTGDEFLKKRVGQFGLFASMLFAGSAVLRLVLSGRSDPNLPNILKYAFLSAAIFFVMWLICRFVNLSRRDVRIVETVGIVSGCGALLLMVQHIPVWSQPHLIAILAFTYPLFLRAVYIPSSAFRTFLLGGVVGLELVALIYLRNLEFDPTPWVAFSPRFESIEPATYARNLAIATSAWWFVTLGTTTAASHVIFDLRQAIRDARQLGQYRLEQKIGQGGMGMVYRASHAMLRRPAAIKLIRPDKVDPLALPRFENEVQLLATLKHPNIVRVFDYGRTPDDVFYYAMELIDGATLHDIVSKTGPMPPARVAHVLKSASRALIEAHGNGLVHRDLKPANIMAFLPHRFGGEEESVKVLDFGLVIRTEQSESEIGIMGTATYVSPEQVMAGAPIDARCDIYSLGCVAYFLLTGTPPIVGANNEETCLKKIQEPPPTLESLGVEPSPLNDVVMACVRRNVNERPQSARQLLRALEHLRFDPEWGNQDALGWWQLHDEHFASTTGPATNTEILAVQLGRSQT